MKKQIIYIFLASFLAFNTSVQQVNAQQDIAIVKVIDNDFLNYMKEVQNPYRYGLNKDVFYPYSTRYGQRIGWGMEIKNKAHYKNGQTTKQADSILNVELILTANSLQKFLKANYAVYLKDGLSKETRQILLDRAFTEGISNLTADFCKAVLDQNWKKLVVDYLYIRQPEGWPDIIRNVAFAQRWIYGKTGKPLITP